MRLHLSSTLFACAHSPSCSAMVITADASLASAAEEYWMTLDFFTNSSNDSISTPVSLRGRLKLQRWDPFTGETTGLASRRERRSGGTYTHFELDLPPVSGVFVVGERRE